MGDGVHEFCDVHPESGGFAEIGLGFRCERCARDAPPDDLSKHARWDALAIALGLDPSQAARCREIDAGLDLAPVQSWARRFVEDCHECAPTGAGDDFFSAIGLGRLAEAGFDPVVAAHATVALIRETLPGIVDAQIRQAQGRLD